MTKLIKLAIFLVSHNNKCVVSFSQRINDIACTCLPKKMTHNSVVGAYTKIHNKKLILWSHTCNHMIFVATLEPLTHQGWALFPQQTRKRMLCFLYSCNHYMFYSVHVMHVPIFMGGLQGIMTSFHILPFWTVAFRKRQTRSNAHTNWCSGSIRNSE